MQTSSILLSVILFRTPYSRVKSSFLWRESLKEDNRWLITTPTPGNTRGFGGVLLPCCHVADDRHVLPLHTVLYSTVDRKVQYCTYVQ